MFFFQNQMVLSADFSGKERGKPNGNLLKLGKKSDKMKKV